MICRLKEAFKKTFNIDYDEKTVLYLGRIHRIKGIDILVKALKMDDKVLITTPVQQG